MDRKVQIQAHVYNGLHNKYEYLCLPNKGERVPPATGLACL